MTYSVALKYNIRIMLNAGMIDNRLNRLAKVADYLNYRIKREELRTIKNQMKYSF